MNRFLLMLCTICLCGMTTAVLAQTNKVLVLDGGYVDLPESATMTTFSDKISIEALVKVDSYVTTGCSILNSGNQTDYALALTPTGKPWVRLYTPNPPRSLDLEGTVNLCLGQWYHIAYTYDGSTAKLYIDGNLDTMVTQTGSVGSSPQPEAISIGACYYNGQYQFRFDGEVDELRLWNIARSASQVSQNTHSSLSVNDRTGLVGYYRFEGNYADSSAYGNHGTPAGSVSLTQEATNRPLLVTAPNSSVSWMAGTTEQITWTSYGLTAVDIEYSVDGGNSWITVATNVSASQGVYNWLIPSTPSSTCLVRLTSSSCESVMDISNVAFTITDPPRFVDFGIFNSSGYDLEVRVKPNADFLNTTMDSIKFTIRWLNSYNVSLGAISASPYYIAKYGTEQVFGLYRYQIFKITIPQTVHWSANMEHLILKVAVNQTGTGTGIFELVTSSLTNAIGGNTTVSLNGVDRTGSYYQAAVSNVPLPIELVSFEGVRIDNSIHLQWSTASETNNRGFGIERLNNPNSDWERIGFVVGNGTTHEQHRYQFIDTEPVGGYAGGSVKYRLKQIDLDGSESYSHEIEVEGAAPTNLQLEDSYPNPFRESTTIRFVVPEDGYVSLDVFNTLGQRVMTLVADYRQAGVHLVRLSGDRLPAGLYLCRLEWNSMVRTTRLVVDR